MGLITKIIILYAYMAVNKHEFKTFFKNVHCLYWNEIPGIAIDFENEIFTIKLEAQNLDSAGWYSKANSKWKYGSNRNAKIEQAVQEESVQG
ncbi:hypothetical protein H1Z61_15340 [Bacillus aquiflavi]|uniref:Uncharacterized protein n=1 Tax=Bacillus aquiflavi TaxID=2672567 RepID=A0A6B3VX32_9BACI|nr:hypothetical protein [Bacillus aquiflavi]MBA4538467.1 hypothetical protein [Bacillus aquiflavi]NEY82830.1 hypothetical protein [Bacillus aquiflavi]UAC48676.1 hypothetical protein K6959_01430 [Bacillus aquiflavi]